MRHRAQVDDRRAGAEAGKQPAAADERIENDLAIGQAQGAAAGLKALDAVDGLEHSHLYHAARGDVLRDLSRKDEALAAYARAMNLVRSPLEMDLLERKQRVLDA